jgi:hypothetical protein
MYFFTYSSHLMLLPLANRSRTSLTTMEMNGRAGQNCNN